ncbi:ribbon-helix-helix domain-containing protein, partial [Escherichia coli]|nr:ribbon-helix-helix domain-containing protein [Escherichia coli]
LPELEQTQEVNATTFVQDAGKRPTENKTTLASFRIPNELLEFIDNESKRLHRPKTKIIKAALLAYQDLDENALITLSFRADRND